MDPVVAECATLADVSNALIRWFPSDIPTSIFHPDSVLFRIDDETVAVLREVFE